MELAPQQAQALDAIGAWLKNEGGPQIFRLFGYAGTGKTTLAKKIAEDSGLETLFAAYTGKAASVLNKKGCKAQTIHSLIYTLLQPNGQLISNLVKELKQNPDKEKQKKLDELMKPKFVLNEESELLNCELIIIDECSMVGVDVAKDLMSFDTKILVLGDPAQLPPVSGEGYFTNAKPDFLLTEIHRQAQGNPIINMATQVRMGRKLGHGKYGSSEVIHRKDLVDQSSFSQVIVGRNLTRHAINLDIRTELEYFGEVPQAGEKLICLRNNRELSLLNGTQWGVEKCEDKGYCLALSLQPWDDELRKDALAVDAHFFQTDFKLMPHWERKRLEEFDFGYAITCHKSQGSQWSSVLVEDESYCFRDTAAKWLYTAITRAEESVTIRM